MTRAGVMCASVRGGMGDTTGCDVLQVRMCADGSNRRKYSREKKHRADAEAVDKLLRTVFKDYVPYFALADTKVDGGWA